MTVTDPEKSKDDIPIPMLLTCRTEEGGEEHGVGLAVAGGEAREEVLVTGGVTHGGEHVRLHKGTVLEITNSWSNCQRRIP